jgi:hypothetical protein
MARLANKNTTNVSLLYKNVRILTYTIIPEVFKVVVFVGLIVNLGSIKNIVYRILRFEYVLSQDRLHSSS